jgi:hypothetical protein
MTIRLAIRNGERTGTAECGVSPHKNYHNRSTDVRSPWRVRTYSPGMT